MSKRTEAILILRQARETLTRRLIERVLEAKEEIFDDAGGGLFVGGIDEIYEQIVTRLSHVNAMLGHLPPEDASVSADTHSPYADDAAPGMAAATVLDTNAIALGHNEVPALPSPYAAPHLTGPSSAAAAPSFRDFGAQIHTGDLAAAGESLAHLFAIDAVRGHLCAQTFADNLSRNPETMTKAMALRKEITSGNFNASLMLLYECFGLTGFEAVGVLQTLMTRLAGNDE